MSEDERSPNCRFRHGRSGPSAGAERDDFRKEWDRCAKFAKEYRDRYPKSIRNGVPSKSMIPSKPPKEDEKEKKNEAIIRTLRSPNRFGSYWSPASTVSG